MKQAHIRIDIELPPDAPEPMADSINRYVQSMLRLAYPTLGSNCWLDDITEPTTNPEPPATPVEWEVSCIAVEHWTRTFRVKAATPSAAIQYAMEHGVIDHDEFIDTESLSNWSAKRCDPQP